MRLVAWAAAALFLASRTAEAACCTAPAGTLVQVELAGEVSTKTQKAGDSFTLRLVQPLVVNGKVLLRPGTPGEGEVIEASRPGMGGKPAKLVLAGRYLRTRHARIAIQGLQLSGHGHDNSMAAQAVGLSGIAFMPLGFVGLAVRGGDVTFPLGTTATAKLASDVYLPSLGRASREMEVAAAELRASANAQNDYGAIEISPPPAGEGQVVFFRRKSILGTGQWFNVRENGEALGKLSNGAYFVQVTAPGVHTYTAKTEPEIKDHLKIEVDPGETYYVEGTLTKGVVIGEADLSPSDRESFDKASKDLKLAPPPSADEPAASSATPADQSAAAQEMASPSR
jgi:hypothetical protein